MDPLFKITQMGVDDLFIDNVKSSLDQIKHFISSPVWADMKEIIELQLNQRHLLLETTSEEELKGLQEAIKALRFVIDIPEMLLDMKESEEKPNTNKEE